MPSDLETIASIIGAPAESFKIKDKCIERDLYLVHYDADKVTEANSHVRGIIVDIKNSKVVCDSFGFIPTITINETNTQEKIKEFLKGNIELNTDNGTPMKIMHDTGFYEVFRMFEGAMIRVFKHNGELMFSTHKKIDCSKSHWGSSKNFKELFLSYIGEEKLKTLNENTPEGTVHYFLLVDKDLLIASKIDLGVGETSRDGFIMYAGSTILNDSVVGNWNLSNILNLHNIRDIHSNESLNEGVFAPENISIDDISEGGIVSYTTPEKKMKHLRIITSEYKKHSDMVANNPNILHRCYTLMTKCLFPKGSDIDTYLDDFEVMDGFTKEMLTQKSDKKVYENRFRNAILNYSKCLPICHQKQALECIDFILEERTKVIEIVCKNYERIMNGDFEGLTHKNDAGTCAHLKHRVSEAVKYAKSNKKDLNIQKNIKSNITMGILRDTGEWNFKIARLLIKERY